MILRRLQVRNFRSIVDTGDIRVPQILALVGENNSGKSNLLSAVDLLVSAGVRGTTREDFYNPSAPIIITGTFGDLLPLESRRWGSYLVNGKLILEKHLWLDMDGSTGREKVSSEFHGYRAVPSPWFLSVEKIREQLGNRPNWLAVVEENDLPEYFVHEGRCDKTIFTKGMRRYREENDVEYDDPDLSQTQALGLESNVVATLPKIYFLKAVTDYSSEVSKRSTTSTFRRLMTDLSTRILKSDPGYAKIEKAIQQIKELLNKASDEATSSRLGSLSMMESAISDFLRKLMPSVRGVSMTVDVDDPTDVFSTGISLRVDDGVETDVLAKGHGLQRCIVFTLLRTLIFSERNQLVPPSSSPGEEPARIILAIEEPELYIHPQLAKLFFDVMREFAKRDQILYSTHSPLFVDVSEHENVALLRKPSVEIGTTVVGCDESVFDGLSDRKIFQMFTKLNAAVNEMFFARRVLLVEGPEDEIAITTFLLQEGMIETRIEQLDWSIVITGGKPAIPSFQRVLNAFRIPYVVLHDTDVTAEMDPNTNAIHKKMNNSIKELAGSNPVVRFPVKLEASLGRSTHLQNQYSAYEFFQHPENMTNEFRQIVRPIFERVPPERNGG